MPVNSLKHWYHSSRRSTSAQRPHIRWRSPSQERCSSPPTVDSFQSRTSSFSPRSSTDGPEHHADDTDSIEALESQAAEAANILFPDVSSYFPRVVTAAEDESCTTWKAAVIVMQENGERPRVLKAVTVTLNLGDEREPLATADARNVRREGRRTATEALVAALDKDLVAFIDDGVKKAATVESKDKRGTRGSPFETI